jgi:hypothetical protein
LSKHANIESLKEWRDEIFKGQSIGGLYGSLLLISTLIVLVVGLVITGYYIFDVRYTNALEHQIGDDLVPGGSISRTPKLLFALPSLMVAVGSFYLLASLFYSLQRRRANGGQS